VIQDYQFNYYQENRKLENNSLLKNNWRRIRMAQIIEGLVYKIFPSLREWEKTAEQAMTYYKGFVETTKSIGDYLNNNGSSIIDRIEKSVGTVLNDLKEDVKKNVKVSPSILKPFASYVQSSKPGNKAKPAAQPGQASAKDEQGAKYAANAARAESARAQPYSPPPAKPSREPYQPTQPAKPIIKNIGKSRAQAGYETLRHEMPRQEQADKNNPLAGKKNSLDELVNDFKSKLKQFNPSYEMKMDVYNNDQVIKSYGMENKLREGQTQANIKPQSEEKKKTVETKYSDLSVKVTELYNQGYRTNEIIKEAVKQGYSAIKNYNDVTELVVAGIKSGISYVKNKYNNAIASKLGAKEQIVGDYLSGKSYAKIKENLKNRTNGMGISDSTILKIMHTYERENGKRVVGRMRKRKISK
jgi:hypothetical protein